MAAMTVAGVFCAPSNGDFFCSAADEERGDENMPVEMNGVAPSYSAHILDIEPLEGGVFRIVVPPGAQPGEAIRVQSPNGGPMLNVVLPRDSQPGAKLTVTPPRKNDLVTVSAAVFEGPPPTKPANDLLAQDLRRVEANQDSVFRIASTIAYCCLFLSLILIGFGIPYTVVGSQMETSFTYLGKACNVTEVDYKGTERSLSRTTFDTFKYKVTAGDGETHWSETTRVRRSGGGGKRPDYYVGELRKCWRPKGDDRRNDLPGIWFHRFNCGNKFCLKLKQPLHEALYFRNLGIYFISFGIMGIIIGLVFDQVAFQALETKDKASKATSKRELRGMRMTVRMNSKSNNRTSWQRS